MKVLVLGHRGMLGQAIMKTWTDFEVIGADRQELDIAKPEEVTQALRTHQPKVVMNCAAYTGVDDCETHELEADLINGTAVGHIAQACQACDAILVHISTDYVFDGQQAAGYTENASTGPINAYGRTKLHGEKELQAFCPEYYLIRTSWLYGPGGKNFVRTMLQLGQTKHEIKVVNDQHGKPTLTTDLSAFIKSLVLERAPYGTYHGINEGATTWYDFARAIFTQARLSVNLVPCSSQEFPRPAQRPAWSILLNTKRPKLRAWDVALRDYLAEINYPPAV